MAAALAIFVTVGCSAKSAGTAGSASSTTSAPATSITTTTIAPPGYSVFDDTADHIQIAVPSSWRQIDPTSPGANQLIQQTVAANPQVRTVLGSGAADLIAKGIKFLALNLALKGSSPTVNLITKPALGIADSDLAQLLPELVQEYQKLGGTVTGHSTVTLSGHLALQIKATLPINTPTGGRITVSETQDVIAANDLAYIVTFAGTSADFPTIEASIRV